MTIFRSSGLQRTFRCMLIDLDDTLYRAEHVADSVRANIGVYMAKKLGIPSESISSMTEELYVSHGTTMAGLVAKGYQIDFDDFHADVHGTLQYTEFLQPDPSIREVLCSINLPKYLLTNADIKHAEKCLGILGLQDCFKGMFCFEHVNEEGKRRGMTTAEFPVLCKPSKKVYELALQMAGADADSTIFIDDSVRNIQAAKDVGIYTVLVGREGPVPGADVSIRTMHDLPLVLPQLIDRPGVVQEPPEPLVPVTLGQH